MALPEKWMANCKGAWFQILVTDKPGHCYSASWNHAKDSQLKGRVTSPLVCKADMPEEIRVRAIRSLIRLCTNEIQKYTGAAVDRVTKVITADIDDATPDWVDIEAVNLVINSGRTPS